ncbi:MAG: hypothetical protein MI974_27855 [Chitinophagales bacterium]|nr:hypothetical protein [Chitinophagales bacterium]
MKKAILYLCLVAIILSCSTSTKTSRYISPFFEKTITDARDSIKYGVIELGNQIWFAENLKFKTPKSICYRKREKNCTNYGRLYPYDELENACPKGWRIPNLNDWQILKAQFQHDSIYALLDTINWETPIGHLNTSGLSLHGTGYQMKKNLFVGEGKATTIWINQMNKYDEYFHAHIFGGEGTYFEKSNYQTNEVLHAHPIENLNDRRFAIRCMCEKKEDERL